MPVSRYALHFARILNRTVRLSKTRLLQSGRGRRGLLAAKHAVGGVRTSPSVSRFTLWPLSRRLCRCGIFTPQPLPDNTPIPYVAPDLTRHHSTRTPATPPPTLVPGLP